MEGRNCPAAPPDFSGATVWWGDPERDWGQATFEGGDIMPVGNGVVLMGMSERTATPRPPICCARRGSSSSPSSAGNRAAAGAAATA